MKRNFLFIFCILVIFTACGSLLFAEDTPENLEVPVGTMIISAPAHFQVTKSPVVFPHSTHLKFSCVACHHDWDRLSPIQGCTSSGCHEKLMPSPPEGNPSQEKRVMSITGAFHRACRGCHRNYLKQDDPSTEAASEQTSNLTATGPIACEECHTETVVKKEYPLTSFSLPLGAMTLSPPDEVEAKRSPVNFPHSLHFDKECQVCHHDWDGISEIQNCTTSGCHDQLEPEKNNRSINNPDNIQYFLTAYHKKCYHCHLDLKKKEQTAVKSDEIKDNPPLNSNAPILCNDCHNG